MTSEPWLKFGTAIAVVASIILQKWDARRVRHRLDASSKKRDAKLDAIHELVDGKMGAQLRLAWIQARRIAEYTKNEKDGEKDAEIAREAERAYNEHQARMVRVDIAASKQVDNPS